MYVSISNKSSILFRTACVQAAVVLAVLDRLGLVGGDPWLEVHLDALSVQSTLFHGRSVSWWQGLRQYMHYIKRVETHG